MDFALVDDFAKKYPAGMPAEAENLPDWVRSIMKERRKRYSPEALALVERAYDVEAL